MKNQEQKGNQVSDDVGKIRDNFAAIKESFAGASAPVNPAAGQIWLDTTAHLLKVRNEANDAWQSVWDMAANKPVIANRCSIAADAGHRRDTGHAGKPYTAYACRYLPRP